MSADYLVVQSPSYTNRLILRGSLVNSKPDAAATMFRAGFRIYPLAPPANPPVLEFVTLPGQVMNTIHANNERFHEELNHAEFNDALICVR